MKSTPTHTPLGSTGVYLFFLFLIQNIDCGEVVLTLTHNLCFEHIRGKTQNNVDICGHFNMGSSI